MDDVAALMANKEKHANMVMSLILFGCMPITMSDSV